MILPLTVLRRLDCVLEPTKAAVLAKHEQLAGKIENVDPVLRAVGGRAVLQHLPARLRRSCSTTRRTSPTTSAPTSPASPAAAKDVIDKFDFDDPDRPARPGQPALPRGVEVRRHRPAPRRRLEPRDGLPLRGTDPPLLRALQRDRRRALHPARGHPADGQPAVHRGRRRCSPSPGSSRRSSTRRAAPAGCSRSPRTTCAPSTRRRGSRCSARSSTPRPTPSAAPT